MHATVTTCKRCPQEIIWAKSASTGKNMPLDADPVPDGNIRLDMVQGELLATVLSREGAAQAARDHVPLRKNHFATCPQAQSFRKKGT